MFTQKKLMSQTILSEEDRPYEFKRDVSVLIPGGHARTFCNPEKSNNDNNIFPTQQMHTILKGTINDKQHWFVEEEILKWGY